MDSKREKDRRNLIDRIPLSEFFTLIITGLMLLTMFLISSVDDQKRQLAPTISAGAGGIIEKQPASTRWGEAVKKEQASSEIEGDEILGDSRDEIPLRENAKIPNRSPD